MLLDPEQRHQRYDAALAVVVDPHGEIDVFDRHDEDEGPQDQRQGAQHRRRIGMRAGVVEHGFQRIERAGADVAEHHAECGETGEREAAVRSRLSACGFDRHFALPSPAYSRHCRLRRAAPFDR